MGLVFSSMILLLAKQNIRLIQLGAEDKSIQKSYERRQRRKDRRETGWFLQAIATLFGCALFGLFAFTIYLQVVEDDVTVGAPTIRVVYSDSMSDKYEKNTYLFENDLNDQFSRFDLIVTHQLPKEEDLQLYDIVVYEVDGVLLVHRIIEIEEPNEKHPDCRYFRLQGDLVAYPDKFPVRYDQMKAIYRGERVPFLGSFVMFLQSPAGYMCFVFLAIEMLTSPLIDKRIDKERKRRLQTLQMNNNRNSFFDRFNF
jgi:hypothetical protein